MDIQAVLDVLRTLVWGGAAGAFIIWLLKNWISEKLTRSIKHEYDERLARYTMELQAESEKQLEMYRHEIRQIESVNQERWKIKRDACIKALNIANAILSNYEYPNVDSKDIVRQEIATSEVRACFNDLACSCDTPDVIDELKRILRGQVRPDAIVDLRSAVRRELGFGKEVVDTDRDDAFVGRVISDPAADEIG